MISYNSGSRLANGVRAVLGLDRAGLGRRGRDATQSLRCRMKYMLVTPYVTYFNCQFEIHVLSQPAFSQNPPQFHSARLSL